MLTRSRTHAPRARPLPAVLLSVNPFKAIPGLYEPSARALYAVGEQSQALDDSHLPPHVYLVARRALADMLLFGRDQSVLIR